MRPQGKLQTDTTALAPTSSRPAQAGTAPAERSNGRVSPGGRATPLLYAALATLMVVTVMAVAYGTSAPALGVAEFAPNARQGVDTPPSTGGGPQQGPSGRGSRRTTTTTLAGPPSTAIDGGPATPPTTVVGRARQCFGNPPRQIEDVQGPACMPTIFEGDNGGATSRGVTGTEIRVAIPTLAPSTTNTAVLATNAMFEYFNQRFELYGRRLTPVYVAGGATSALTARALGANVAAQGVFAALNAVADAWVEQSALVSALARDKVIAIDQNLASFWTDRLLYDQLHPYAWTVYPSGEHVQASMADFACRALEGKAARFAGSETLRSKARKFGILAIGSEQPPASGVLLDMLNTCSDNPVERLILRDSDGAIGVRTGLTRLRDAGVTTMLCLCEGGHGLVVPQDDASGMGFLPEWILSAGEYFGYNDDEPGVKVARQQGMVPPIRLNAGPYSLPLQAQAWYQALQSTGSLSLASPQLYLVSYLYSQLLVLASGIQSAGPNLNPETFAAGLMSTQFPNPNVGKPPFWQGTVGFGPGDHAFYDDYNVGWWSDMAPSLYHMDAGQPKGSWCYIGGGARYSVGTFPADAESQLFNPAAVCR